MGQKITREEAKSIFYEYKKTFKTMVGWLESQQETAAREFRMVNINGRSRRWMKPNWNKIYAQVKASATKNAETPFTEELEYAIRQEVEEKYNASMASIKREGANFQIQSVNADFTKAAMYELRKEFKRRGWDARMYNSVYDEIVMDMDASIAEEAHELQKKIMKQEADKMLKKVPMEVEGHLETHWTK